MKQLIFLTLAVLLVASPLLAWYYTVQTSWNGSIHVTGSTSFTPSSVYAYVKMTAPTNRNCPVCSQDPPAYAEYTTIAKLWNPSTGTTYLASKQCGGCAANSGQVTTNQTWNLSAILDETCIHSDVQQQSWGPVKAESGSSIFQCSQEGPGGE